MTGYKHVNPEFADLFESGESIQIGSYTMYREMENERGDPVEGSRRYHIEHLLPQHLYDPQYARAREIAMVPEVPLGVNLSYRNNTVTYEDPELYVFSVSDRPDTELQARGTVIFEISDLALFALRLRRECKKLGIFDLGPVKYVPEVHNPFVSGELQADPFRKSDRFRHENELRIVWIPNGSLEPYIRIRSRRAAQLAKRL